MNYSDRVKDEDVFRDALCAMAWALGIVAMGSVLRVVVYAAEGLPVHAELFVWVLVGAIAAAFSACCAVLAGVRSAESRLHERAGRSTTLPD